jgi:hypothetical protein
MRISSLGHWIGRYSREYQSNATTLKIEREIVRALRAWQTRPMAKQLEWGVQTPAQIGDEAVAGKDRAPDSEELLRCANDRR